jgi:tRNA nucleotidyltransferase/poly(A) polymerase
VGGQQDLAAHVVRAIGSAEERLREDKLRMLRAVRLAVMLGFEIEPNTLAAVVQHAHEIAQVSAERIADELRQVLTLPQRRRGAELLEQTGLLQAILPEIRTILQHEAGIAWARTLAILAAIKERSFPSSVAVLLREIPQQESDPPLAERISRRWRLSNGEALQIGFCLRHESLVRRASSQPWSRLQPVLVQESIGILLDYASAVAQVCDGGTQEVDFCRQRLELPIQQLNPKPLITGDDLVAVGIAPGPIFRTILETVRDAQLEGHLTSRDAALQLAREMVRQTDPDST